MIGTLVNAGAIVAGSVVGLLVHARLSRKMTDIAFQGIGLFTVALGVALSLRSQHLVSMVVSLVAGSLLGQWADLEKRLRRFSDGVQRRLGGKKTASEDDAAKKTQRFTEGFVTASMLFCVGSMSVLGAIEDGTGHTPNLLFTKSIMDGISAVALSVSFGISVAFSAVPLLLYQGGLTLFAAFIMRFFSDAMIADLTAVGGVLLIGLGIHILKIKEISVVNMLPALVIAVVLARFFP